MEIDQGILDFKLKPDEMTQRNKSAAKMPIKRFVYRKCEKK